jgi:hypothetical protein
VFCSAADFRQMKETLYLQGFLGAPEEIRTPDPQIRSLVLYPAELRARFHEAIGLNGPAASDKGPDGRERAL